VLFVFCLFCTSTPTPPCHASRAQFHHLHPPWSHRRAPAKHVRIDIARVELVTNSRSSDALAWL